MLGGCECVVDRMVGTVELKLYTSGGAYNGGYPGPEASSGLMQPQVYGDGYGMYPQVCIWIEFCLHLIFPEKLNYILFP